MFLWFDWELGRLFLMQGLLFQGQVWAKLFFMAILSCPVQPDSIPHDLRLLANTDKKGYMVYSWIKEAD